PGVADDFSQFWTKCRQGALFLGRTGKVADMSFRTNYREPEPAPASLLPPPPVRHEIFVPLEPDDLMLSAACYLFWPLLAPVIMLGRRSRIAFVRFHCVQATWFGVL